MLMLNISVAKYIVKEFTSKQLNDLNELSQKLKEELKELPEREVKKGIRRSPEEVKSFILKIMEKNPVSVQHTRCVNFVTRGIHLRKNVFGLSLWP